MHFRQTSRLLGSFAFICALTLQQPQHARAFAPQHLTLSRAPRAASCRVTGPRRKTTVGLGGNLEDGVTTSWSKDDNFFEQREQKKQEDIEQDVARKKRWQLQEQFMEAQGATYAILWVRTGEYFVVAKDFTTTERRNATRIVRRDNKTFASEVRLLQIHADGAGPVATAARSLEQQVVPAHASNPIPPPTLEATSTPSRDYNVRSDLAEEFSVKNIHFIPLTDGSKLLSIFGAGMYETTSFRRWAEASAGVSPDTRKWDGAAAVLEYGVPAEPEVLSVKLLSLLIQEMSLVKTFGAFMVLSLEIISTLRVIVFVEGPTQLMAGVRKSALAVVEGTMASDKKSAQAQLSSGGTSSKEYRLYRITKFFLKPVVVVVATMTYVVEGYNNWKERRRQAKMQVDED